MLRSPLARTWRAGARTASVTIMPRWRAEVSLCVIVVALVASSALARAGVARRSHRVSSGDSLWTIARTYRCTVDDLRRANRLDSDTLQPGQRLRIPTCESDDEEQGREEEQARGDDREREDEQGREDDRERDDEQAREEESPDEVEVARADLPDVPQDVPDEVVIGEEEPARSPALEMEATRTEPSPDNSFVVDPIEPAPTDDEMVPIAVPIVGQSIGRPQNGYLVSGKRLPSNPKLYHLRRPERAWGTSYTVKQLVRAMRHVRRRYPGIHPLAIGDLSARHGGRISMHGSHQSGRDADLGFYFRKTPRGYPRTFAYARMDNLHFNATWALISALCKTASDPSGGVERIYMTYRTQRLFYRLARKHRVPRSQLEWFQYPHGRRANRGIIRHEPGHEEHIHVRFRCAEDDPECR
jgi:murein endopeptidase/LysM repeat protein